MNLSSNCCRFATFDQNKQVSSKKPRENSSVNAIISKERMCFHKAVATNKQSPLRLKPCDKQKPVHTSLEHGVYFKMRDR